MWKTVMSFRIAINESNISQCVVAQHTFKV